MTPSSKVKRTYITRQKEAERLKKLVQENRKKKRPRDSSSDDDSLTSQMLGQFELCFSEDRDPEIEIIPPWSDDDDDDDDEGEEGDGDDEVVVLGRVEVGSCSGVKKDGTFAKNVTVIDVDMSEEEEEKKNGESCSSYGSVGGVFDDEEDEDSDDEDYNCEEQKEASFDEEEEEEDESYSEDEDEVEEKKDKKEKKKTGNVTSKHKSRKYLSSDESYSVDELNGRKGKRGKQRKKIVKERKKSVKTLSLDEFIGSTEDDVVVIRKNEDDFKKKKKDVLINELSSSEDASVDMMKRGSGADKGKEKSEDFEGKKGKKKMEEVKGKKRAGNLDRFSCVQDVKGGKDKKEKEKMNGFKVKKSVDRFDESESNEDVSVNVLKNARKGKEETFKRKKQFDISDEPDCCGDVHVDVSKKSIKVKKEKQRDDCKSKNPASSFYVSDSGQDDEKHGLSGVNSVLNNGSKGKKGKEKGGNFMKKKDKAVPGQDESGSGKHNSDLFRKGSKVMERQEIFYQKEIDGKILNLGRTNSCEDEEEHVCCSCVLKKASKCKQPKEKKETLKGKKVGRDDSVDKTARDSNTGFAVKSEVKDVKLGTPSRPFCIDVGEDGEEEAEAALGDNENNEEHCGMEEKKQSGRMDCGPKNFDLINALANSMFDEDEAHAGYFASSGDLTDDRKTDSPDEQPTLPLKFRFGVMETKTPEKSDSEKEMDRLWDQFEFLRGCSQIGSADYETVDDGDPFPQDSSVDVATRCRQDNHHCVLDEEIGIVCKYCSVVKLEIKNVLPSFSRNPWERRSERREKERDKGVTFDKIQLEDFGYDSQPGGDSPVHTKGTVWELVPGAYNIMYPHQRDGFVFIWRNIAGSIKQDELKSQTSSNKLGGCIISHAPGTGKSRLTIVFLQAYLKFYPKCRPVLIAPKQMLVAWNEELIKWKVDIPFHNLSSDGFSGKENVAAKQLCDGAKHHRRKVTSTRLVKLFSWKKDGGILGISYTLFEKLAGGGKTAEKESKRKPKERHFEDTQIEKALLQISDLLVLDEGHTPRNKDSSIFKALSNIRTEKRIILSGTPFQNNFDELFNTLCLVRPKFIESFRSNLYFQQNPAQRQNEERKKWNDLVSPIGKASDRNALKRLKDMLEPFVHIHKGDILREKLPGLKDFVLILKPGELQKNLLEGIQGMGDQFTINHLSSLVSVHPALLPESEKDRLSSYVDEIVRVRMNPDAGAKTKFLIELVKFCQLTNEKVLVFSEFLAPLIFIIEQLKSCFGWADGRELLYMDGQVDVKQRQNFLNVFNDSTSEAKVLMASIKAFGEGINLVGASRVILLDVVWNPSVERQAISRAYRIGQKKIVYVYQLISGSGTLERDKYDRRVNKKRLSKLVFSSTEVEINGQNTSAVKDANGHEESYSDEILEELRSHNKLKHMFEKVYYQSKESELIETFALVDGDIANCS